MLRSKRKLVGVDDVQIPSALEAGKRTKLAREQEKAEREEAQRARDDEVRKKSEDQARNILLAFPKGQKAASDEGKTHWDVDILNYFAVDAQLITNLLRLHLSGRRHDYIVEEKSRYDNKKSQHVSYISISWAHKVGTQKDGDEEDEKQLEYTSGGGGACDVCPEKPTRPHIAALSDAESRAALNRAAAGGGEEALKTLIRDEAQRHTGAYLLASARFMSYQGKLHDTAQKWVDEWHPLLCCEQRHFNRLVATHTAHSLALLCEAEKAADKVLVCKDGFSLSYS